VPRVIITRGPVAELNRCRNFLAAKNPQAAKRAAIAINRRFDQLETAPETGRPFADQPELRELVIRFGDSGYAALYRYTPADDAIHVLAFRHQKEAGC
jgi:plasmid stabilization system protein ParE